MLQTRFDLREIKISPTFSDTWDHRSITYYLVGYKLLKSLVEETRAHVRHGPSCEAGKQNFLRLCLISAGVRTALFLGHFIRKTFSVSCFLW